MLKQCILSCFGLLWIRGLIISGGEVPRGVTSGSGSGEGANPNGFKPNDSEALAKEDASNQDDLEDNVPSLFQPFDVEGVHVRKNYSSLAVNSTVYPEGAVWNGALIQRVVTLSIIMLMTLIGNSVIITVLSRSRYRKRSSRVNIFILNLAVGDLAVCAITMTSELLFEVFGEWVLGNLGCKFLTYMQIVTLASTTFILTSMTYDRYEAICRPLHSTFANGVERAKRMIATSWTLAFIFAIPQIFIFVQVEKGITVTGRVRYECLSQGYTSQWQRKLYFTWLTCYILVIPFCCIFFCYASLLRAVWKAARVPTRRRPCQERSGSGDAASGIVGSKKASTLPISRNGDLNASTNLNCSRTPKEAAVMLRRSFNAASNISRAKIKTLKFTICIILSFLICWTPYFVVHNIRIYSDYKVKIAPYLLVGAETLALLNSALNPIFYGYYNVRLRKGFIEIVYRKRDLGSCVTAQTSYTNGNAAPANSAAGVPPPHNSHQRSSHNSDRRNDCLECVEGSYSSGSYRKDSGKRCKRGTNNTLSGSFEMRPLHSSANEDGRPKTAKSSSNSSHCLGFKNGQKNKSILLAEHKCDSV